MFDPKAFLDTPVEGANSTKIEPVPEGTYTALIQDVKAEPWQSKDGSKSGGKITMQMVIDDAELSKKLDRERISIKYDIMLDLTESGGLDLGKGKNVRLGRLREAVGLNVPGKPFAFQMLEGQLVKAMVSQRIDGDDIYNDIKTVTKHS
jgi:hypothetical protein